MNRPCPHCIAGNRRTLSGNYVRCNHRPPFYLVLHPIAIVIAAFVEFCREAAYNGD